MLTSPTTFIVGADHRATAVTALAWLGYHFVAPRFGTFMLLDTFDGRLHRAGLRLVVHDVDGVELVLSDDGVVAAHLTPALMPRSAGDLPQGPFRSRIAAITDVRALLPQVRVTATRTRAICRDGDGRTVGSVVLYEHIAAVGDDDTLAQALPATTVEVHEVVGSRKHARRAVEALAGLGFEAIDGDTLEATANAAGVDLNGFEASPTVPLDPDMPAVEGVRDLLANLADTIDANWQGTIEHIDTEFLHDLRVAVRRTRTVASQAKLVLPPDVVAEARDGFAWLGGLTGPARDLDVYLIEWDGYVRPLGADALTALDPVRRILAQRQTAAHAALDDALRSPAATALMATWHKQLGELTSHEPQGPHADRVLEQVVRRRIERAQATLVEHGRLIRADTPAEQVHDLRKHAKKLRYLLECFGSLLPDRPRKQFVQRLKALQDNLGAHQDAEVHVAVIREIASTLHERGAVADTLLAIGQLTGRLEQIRIATRAEFAERFAAYDTKATQRALDAALHDLHR